MSVRNPLKDAQDAAIPATINLSDLARAMQQLDLSSVPPDRTADAIRDHLHRVMADTAVDPEARADAAQARAAVANKVASLSADAAIRRATVMAALSKR